MSLTKRVFLCADIGTSSLKAALIDADGKALAFQRESYPYDRVVSGTTQAEDWAQALKQAIAAMTGGKSPSRMPNGEKITIAAVCLSGNGPTLVPLYADGSSGQALHWHDGKLEKPIAAKTTGPVPLRSLFLPRAAWFKHQRGEDYQQLRWLLSSQEWLSFQLGAEAVTILPTPDYRPYYWDEEQLSVYDLDSSLFPPFAALGEQIGTVSKLGAKQFGLPAGLPIIAGGPDFIMALIGAGALYLGLVLDRAGTSEGINICASRPIKSPELRSLPHPSIGLWNIAALLPITGRLFDWYRSITGQQARGYDEIIKDIALASRAEGQDNEALVSDGFFFPDLKATGSLQAASAFLATAGFTTQAQLGRAVVEAIGFMVRNAIDSLEKHGFRIDGMRLSGGQAKNLYWNKLKADITGRCLLVPEIADCELAGNAAAILLALGEADNLEDAADRIVRIDRIYEPNRTNYARYSERYDRYRRLLQRMAQFFP